MIIKLKNWIKFFIICNLLLFSLKQDGCFNIIVLGLNIKSKLLLIYFLKDLNTDGVPKLSSKPRGGGGTPIYYLYGYVSPNGVVILKLLV